MYWHVVDSVFGQGVQFPGQVFRSQLVVLPPEQTRSPQPGVDQAVQLYRLIRPRNLFRFSVSIAALA